MNKKFFTLLAAALFGTSAAFAQILPGDKALSKLNQGALYHVGTDTEYLYVQNDTLLFGNADALASGLWCVKAETPVNSTYPLFTFENKGEERFLSVDLQPYLEGGSTSYQATLNYSDINSWRFSSKFINSLDTEANYLMSYLPGRDSVAVLSNNGGKIYVNIVPAPAAGTTPTVATGTLIEANLYDADAIVLDAEAFNTLFGSRDSAARKLNYIDPKIDQLESSAFTDAFSAEDASTTGYLNLKNANGYLRVDTAVYNNAGNPYLKYAYTKAADFATSAIPALHNFRFVYLPSVDSLIINVEEAYQPTKSQIDNNTPRSAWTHLVSNDTAAEVAAQTGDDKTYLVIQNLTQQKFCLTVGELPTQLWIGLGFAGCEVAEDERASLASDLYTIQNEKGQYLVAPIYTDSISAPLWVTLEENVDPLYIPAYQWLVVRNREDSDKSTLAISNREYTDAAFTVADLQLKKDKAVGLFSAPVVAAGFKAVPASFKKDAYLGYKHINKDDAQITSYIFKYLHKLAGESNVQLGVNADSKDSLLYVGEKTTFELHPSSTAPVQYGNYSAKIKDLSKLVRLSYEVSVKDVAASSKLNAVNRYIGVDEENRYAVIDPVIEDRSIFYLKANNVVGDAKEVYYALVDTNFIFTDSKNVKAGVDDNNLFLKVQSQREVRTSAFSVAESESPIYRRFNREGAVKSESFYSTDKAADVRDTLKFFRVNEPNNFLYEDANSTYSKGLGINFLGQKHKADFDDMTRTIQLIVDTAYVARPATATTKKDTPKPQYLLWSTLKYVDSETLGGDDECNCEPVVVTDAYSIGRLLINATDSTKLANVGKNYLWDNKWERLVFTWAVRSAKDADILYIVDPAKFAKIAEFTYENLEKSGAVIRKFDLGNNLHKDVVFSFRLYENEDEVAYADQVQNFFIESESGERLNGKQTNDVNSNGIAIAPMIGGWVKIHNGVPVISRGAFDEKKINDAERFNVHVDNSGETPVANEDINATDVQVVAGNGNVTIFNAAGKTVTISNILGQSVASQVITSDNVTIAAPKGIVVVSVDGKAVKAIVK